jgi:1,2-phenylacetyl-CoA epoxidase PaaB subunit
MSFDDCSYIVNDSVQNKAKKVQKKAITNIWAVNSSHEISEDESEEQPIIISSDEMERKLYEIRKSKFFGNCS